MSLPSRQRGAALFLVLLLIVVGAGIAFVSQLKSAEVELEAQRKTAAALAEAKQALIGWALLDNGGGTVNPGRLPCPDQDRDGDAEGAACAAPYIGWLPRETLDMDDMRDGAAEMLWYVVDSNFRSGNAPLNTAMLSSTAPALRLNGVPVVAVVFAPHGVLSSLSQSRPAGVPVQSTLVYPNYLESFAASGPSVTTAPPSSTFNDHLIGITPRELFTPVTQRIARELAQANAPGVGGYTATGIGGLVKPQTWTDNGWDAAVDAAASSVTSSTITLKFRNCDIVYTITGTNAVALSPRSC